MASLSSIRHARPFSTSSVISITKAKAIIKSEHDLDKVLATYSVADHSKSPVSSLHALDITIRRLAKSRRFVDIEALIESQKKDPKFTQEPFFSFLIRSYGQAGMFDQAYRTFNQMDELGTPRSPLSLNALLSACNKSKKFDQVPNLFSEIPQKYGICPDKVSYGILIKSLCESGLPESAFPVLTEMEEKNVEITAVTYTTILDALYKKGKMDEADKIWNKMADQGSTDVAAYNVRIRHIQEGKPEEIMALIDEMVLAGLKPGIITYNYLLTCYCRNGMMEDANKVYAGLKGNGCLPNAATFSTLTYYFCKNGDFEKGMEIFKESLKRNRVLYFEAIRFLVEGLVRSENLGEARKVIEMVKKKFPHYFSNELKELEMHLCSGGEDVEATAQKEASTSMMLETDHGFDCKHKVDAA